jgi:hypothetical protein
MLGTLKTQIRSISKLSKFFILGLIGGIKSQLILWLSQTSPKGCPVPYPLQ